MQQELTYKQMLDFAFYRPLKNEYPEDIFPEAKCEAFSLGRGDIFHSVESITYAVYDFQTFVTDEQSVPIVPQITNIQPPPPSNVDMQSVEQQYHSTQKSGMVF